MIENKKKHLKIYLMIILAIMTILVSTQSLAVSKVEGLTVKMEGEKEDFYACGDTLMYGGVRLKQAFGGTGYNNEVRYFQDFGSRLYLMEAQELSKKATDIG